MENLENINVAAEDAVTPVEDVADTVAEVDEEFDDFDSDAEFDLDFEARRSRIKNPVRRILFGKKYIGFAFLVPAVLMTLIYVALGVWPVGERSALVLDLNAQYV